MTLWARALTFYLWPSCLSHFRRHLRLRLRARTAGQQRRHARQWSKAAQACPSASRAYRSIAPAATRPRNRPISLGGRGPALTSPAPTTPRPPPKPKNRALGLRLVRPLQLTPGIQGRRARSPSSRKTAPPRPSPWKAASTSPVTGFRRPWSRIGASYVFTLPTQEELTFNSEGKLTEVKDRNGNALTLLPTHRASYRNHGTSSGELPNGFDFRLHREPGDERPDPMGHKVKYAYESGNLDLGDPARRRKPGWKFKYDASHQLTEMTNGRGGVTKT